MLDSMMTRDHGGLHLVIVEKTDAGVKDFKCVIQLVDHLNHESMESLEGGIF